MDRKAIFFVGIWAGAILSFSTGMHFVAGGLETIARYKQSVYPDFPVNRETLLYFVSESAEMALNRFKALVYTPGSEVPTIDLYAAAADLAELDSDLPNSGKSRYITGYMKASDEVEPRPVKFRYRGDLPFHWFYNKKSFRIKVPDFDTYRNEKVFNLVHPTTLSMVSDRITYGIAREHGLLAPDFYPVRVRINSADNGLHFYLSQPTETFLRKNRRMPGNIYSGDRQGRRGTAFSNTYQGYHAADGTALLWKDARLWKKVAARNAESEHDFSDLQKFIEIANQVDPVVFYKEFQNYFDVEKYFKYFAIDTLVGSEHHDYFHNHKFYFDPYKGKFEPIEWDVRKWNAGFPYKDIAYYPLLDKVKRNPRLEFERDRIAYRMMLQYDSDEVIRWIQDSANQIVGEVRSDPHRMIPQHHELFPFEKNRPFSADDFTRSVQDLVETYLERNRILKEIYSESSAVFRTESAGDGWWLLHVSVSGNSPIIFDPYQLIDGSAREGAIISRVYGNSSRPVLKGQPEILYPGSREEAGNFSGVADENSIAAFGTFKLVPSPLKYTYRISASEVDASQSLTARNAVTGQGLKVTEVVRLPESDRTVSVHPWLLDDNEPELERQVVLEGNITINSDRIYGAFEQVTIAPGTHIHIAPGRSIVFRGRVQALGTVDNPIRFSRSVAAFPWGAVVVHGKAASHCIFRYVHVSGGSVGVHRLVSYPGQFNIHDVESFQISQSRFGANVTGDDSVHLAYSTGIIEDCNFSGSFSDALDIDLSIVDLRRSKFTNSGNDGVDLMDSRVRIDSTAIGDSGDKCISVGERSRVTLSNLTLSQCTAGIAVKDESQVTVDHLYFSDKGPDPISLYQKNPRYRFGGSISGSNVHGIIRKDIRVGKRSQEQISLTAER